jgi:mercuric reductase
MEPWTMNVAGMTCESCERHVARAIQNAGGREVSESWRSGTATFSAGAVDRHALVSAVAAAGYQAGDIRRLPLTPMPEGHAGHTRGASEWDLAIVGSGSAAFAAAIRARDLGASVVMIERSAIGGTCVNVGCVPSKALIRAGEIQHVAAHHSFAGLQTSAGPVDLRALVGHKDDLVETLRAEKYEDLLGEYGIDLNRGAATFTGPTTLTVDGRTIAAGKYLVATGAAPAAPPIPGLDDVGYLTSTSGLELAAVPGSLAVIGANAIGLELGQFFSHAGSSVTFFDALERIAPFEELEISDALSGVLRDQGAAIHTGARITRVERDGDKKVVIAAVESEADQVRVVVDEILVATGRRPNTANLGVSAAGIALTPGGAVEVNQHLRTTNPVVYAAGDVTAAPQFVYVAAHHGALAAENAITGATRSVDLDALPRIIFTTPPVAAAGLTEQAATEAGLAVKTSLLPLSAVPRALVNRETAGLVKIVADADTDKILGVHLLADGAGDVIQAAIYAIKFGLTTADLATTWAPYLTMAEGLKLAAQTFTRDVAKLSCCAA